jgi:hypothetical protein
MRVQHVQDLDLGTIRLMQRPYWEHVIAQFDLEHVSPRNVPLPVGVFLDNAMSPTTDSERCQTDDKPYRPILGSVTRPNPSSSLAVSFAFPGKPGTEHCMVHQEYDLSYCLPSSKLNMSPCRGVRNRWCGCRAGWMRWRLSIRH